MTKNAIVQNFLNNPRARMNYEANKNVCVKRPIERDGQLLINKLFFF